MGKKRKAAAGSANRPVPRPEDPSPEGEAVRALLEQLLGNDVSELPKEIQHVHDQIVHLVELLVQQRYGAHLLLATRLQREMSRRDLEKAMEDAE